MVWDHGTTVDVVYNKLQGISARASAPVSNGAFDVTANGVRFQGQVSGSKGSQACTLTLSGAVTWTPAMIYLSDGVLSPWTDARMVTLAGPFDEFGVTYQFSALLNGFFKIHTDGQGIVSTTPNVAKPNVAGEAHYLNQIQVEGGVTYTDDNGAQKQLTVSRQ